MFPGSGFSCDDVSDTRTSVWRFMSAVLWVSARLLQVQLYADWVRTTSLGLFPTWCFGIVFISCASVWSRRSTSCSIRSWRSRPSSRTRSSSGAAMWAHDQSLSAVSTANVLFKTLHPCGGGWPAHADLKSIIILFQYHCQSRCLWRQNVISNMYMYI